MTVIKYVLVPLLALFLFSACSIKQEQQKTTVSKEYATLLPSMDSKHYEPNLHASTIFIRYINERRFNKFTQRQKVKYLTKVGKLKVYVQEEYNSDYIFSSVLKFEAKKSQEYRISSTHEIYNGKIVNMEFYVVHKGRVITKVKAKRKRKASTPLTIPSSI